MTDAPRTVTINEAPAADPAPGPTTSADNIAAALLGSDETLKDGRVIRLRKPTNPLVQFSLVRNVGAEIAANTVLMQMITPLIYIESIDGDPVFLPRSYLEVEALITRLGEDGINTVLGWYMRYIHFPAQQSMQDANDEALRDSVKN